MAHTINWFPQPKAKGVLTDWEVEEERIRQEKV
jgi:hypothetical protein